nr:hypothetical protein [Tanacetum cinerariifolium]
MECWEDTSDVSIGKEGLVDSEGQSDGINEDMSTDLGVNRNSRSASVKMVSNPFFESNSFFSKHVNDCLDKNSGVSSKSVDVMSEILAFVSENPILNLDFASSSKPKSPSRVSFREVRRPCMFKVSDVGLFKRVGSVSNFEVGEGNKINDANMSDNGSVKKSFSFMSALIGGRVSGDNKLKFVPSSVNNEGREISYREIMGNLRRMWRPYEFDDIIMNNSGLYFCKFKSHDGMQIVIENGPWVGNPIIMDRITTAMCEKSYGIASFVRVLMDLDSVKALVGEVEAYVEKCLSKNSSEEEKRIKESVKPISKLAINSDRNERWRTMNYKRGGYCRGGFINGGRGSFSGGRGGYMNNGGRGNGVTKKYVPKSNEKEGMKVDKKDLCDMGSNGMGNVNSNNGNGFIQGSNSKKIKFKNNNDKVLTPEEVLKSMIDGLQKQIVEGNKGLRKNAERVAEQRIIDECASKKTDDMVEYENDSGRINGYWCDVDEGSNFIACFMAQDDVSNMHDEFMADMQGGVASHSSNFK